ncbi:MAG TPA: HAMP domain-containing sensor histidine kinase [Pseudonocardiaceae bacterium]
MRTKLSAVSVLLVAVVCVVIGLATVLSLRAFLINELDSQLGHAAQGPPPRPGDGPALCGASAGTVPPFPRGLPPNSINADFYTGGGSTGSLFTTDLCQVSLSTTDIAALAPSTRFGVPYTRQVGSLGDYRLVAVAERPLDGSSFVAVFGLPMTSVNQTMTQTGLVIGGAAGIALVAAGLAGAAIVRRTLRPLRRVADTASRVAELELDRGDVALSVRVPDADTDPSTEVGQVGAALNRMLGHIAAALSARQASETRVRQFVADASHELRTPLAAIRGYAELTRRSGDDVPPNVAHAIRRVESESARMTLLVNDLLLLARLDSGRPLDSEQVDLSRLVVDAVSDAHIAGPRHAWRLDLPPDPVVVTGDTQRLHQVLANLLSNARTHTPPGTTVTTGLAAADGKVVLTVADNGPGIPPEVLPEAFERFARADTSRSRNAGSTGLGLAIVAAVVAAHDGAVTVTSVPGDTVFTVRLPRHSFGTAAPQE